MGLSANFLAPPFRPSLVEGPRKGVRPPLPFQSIGETVGLALSEGAKYWSEWQDLNLLPPRPERGALPDCAHSDKRQSYTIGLRGYKRPPFPAIYCSRAAPAYRRAPRGHHRSH
jgi:hypothetical protein